MDQKEFARMGYDAFIKNRGLKWMKEISRRGVVARKAKSKLTKFPIDNTGKPVYN